MLSHAQYSRGICCDPPTRMLRDVRYPHSVWVRACYTMSGTHIAYGFARAPRRAVLTWRIVLCDVRY
eukprot:616016-Rhodomonas_salina.1